MLMAVTNMLELDTFRPHQLPWHFRIVRLDTSLAEEFDGDAGFLHHFAHSGFVR